MNEKFFILDTTYEVINGIPVVYIWSITQYSERVLLVDDSFRPYFYVLPNGDIGKTIEGIMSLSKRESPLKRVETVSKKYFGREIEVIYIETVIPASVKDYREVIKKRGFGIPLEADIRFSLRYMIDKGIFPFRWYNLDVTERPIEPGFRVTKAFTINRIIGEKAHELPALRKMAFDIETYNKSGLSNPKEDPIIIAGLMTDTEQIQFTATGKGSNISDKSLIESLRDYIIVYDPDIVSGYNQNQFDIPYILERASVNKVKFDVNRRKGSEPTQGTFGHFSMNGRINLDLIGFVRSMNEIKIKTLENVAHFFGIMDREKRVVVPWNYVYRYWDDDKQRETLMKHNMDDVVSTYRLMEMLLPYGIELSSLTGLPLDQLSMASVGHRVEWLLIRKAVERGELIPNREEKDYETYQGGLVLPPLPGIHEEVTVLDFSSMYPSIMIKYNIGPDTLVEGECRDCYEAPEVGHKFRKSPDGFFRSVLKELVQMRREVKRSEASEKNEYRRRLLQEKEKAIKVMTNALYGYMGWLGARWYSKQGAEAVTAWGREIISDSASIARTMGFNVVYGDTDSIFVQGKQNIDQLVGQIREKFEIDIKVEKQYKRVFFTKSKKRYAGLTTDDEVDIVGFEAVRGDWCELAKNAQQKVIEHILRKGEVEGAVKLIIDMAREIHESKISLDMLVIWKTIEKPLNQYEVSAPHVSAAKKALQNGYDIRPGGKIGYIITKGKGKLSERAIPYFMANVRDVDPEYYITKQLIPATSRVLENLGYDEETLNKTVMNELKKTDRGNDITKFFN